MTDHREHQESKGRPSDRFFCPLKKKRIRENENENESDIHERLVGLEPIRRWRTWWRNCVPIKTAKSRKSILNLVKRRKMKKKRNGQAGLDWLSLSDQSETMTDRRLREKNNKRGPRNRCGKKARKKKENKAGNKRIPVRNSPRCRCSFIFLSLSFFFVSVSNFVLPVFRYFFFLHLFCLLSFTVSVPSKTKRRERKGHVYINIFYFFLFLFHFFLLFVSSFRRFDGRRTRTDQSTGRGVGGSRWMLETGAYLKFFRLGVAGRNGNTAAVTAITTAAADSSLHGIPTIPALTPFFCFPWFLLCFLFSLFFFHLPCVCVCVCVRPCVFLPGP